LPSDSTLSDAESTAFSTGDDVVSSLKKVPDDRRLSAGDEVLLVRSDEREEEVRLGGLGRSSTGTPDPRTLERASRSEIRRLLRL
jgi:hypothetical protein